MNLSDKRSAIKADLSELDFVRGYEYPPNPARSGDAWTAQGPITIDTTVGQFTDNFQVVVMTPQSNERAAYDFMSEHWEAIVVVLSEHGYVDRAEMILLQADTGTQWAIQFTMRSE